MDDGFTNEIVDVSEARFWNLETGEEVATVPVGHGEYELDVAGEPMTMYWSSSGILRLDLPDAVGDND